MRTTDLASITRLGRVQASASLFPTRTFYIPERRRAENRSPTTHPYSRCQLRCSERTRLHEKPDGFFQKPHAYMIEGRRKDARRLHERRARNALDWSGIGVHQIDRLTRYPRSSLTSLEPVLIFGPFGIAASSPPSYHCLGRGAAVAILAGGRCFPTAPDASISRGQKLEPDRNGAGSGEISPSNPNG
jgi:hypothetical protein